MLFSLPFPPPLPCGAGTRGIAAHRALSSAIDNGAGTVVLFSLSLSLYLCPVAWVQMRVQAEAQVQQRPVFLKFLLVAEGVKQHTALLNLQANWGKQVQGVWKCPMELSQEGVQQHIALLNLQADWGKHQQVQEV